MAPDGALTRCGCGTILRPLGSGEPLSWVYLIRSGVYSSAPSPGPQNGFESRTNDLPWPPRALRAAQDGEIRCGSILPSLYWKPLDESIQWPPMLLPVAQCREESAGTSLRGQLC